MFAMSLICTRYLVIERMNLSFWINILGTNQMGPGFDGSYSARFGQLFFLFIKTFIELGVFMHESSKFL